MKPTLPPRRQSPPLVGEVPEVNAYTCERCGTAFERPPSRNGRVPRFCSKRCKDNGYLARDFICQHCGTAWSAESKPGRPPAYCSPECRRLEGVARAAAWYESNRDRVPLQPAQQPKVKAARWAAYYAANRERLIAASVLYARTNPEQKRARDAARYALTRGAPYAERFTLDEVFERDRKRCHLCRKRVARKDATIDHLVPVALGGEHTRANVALAHRSCNSSKKTKPMGEQLALLG